MNSFLTTAVLAVTRTSDIVPEYTAPVVSSGPPWLWIGAGVAAMACLGIGYLVMQSSDASDALESDAITMELCRVHGIGMQHRASLDHVAKLAGVQHTAELFLSEKLFDAAVAKATQVKRMGTRQRGLIFEVRHCLYDPAHRVDLSSVD